MSNLQVVSITVRCSLSTTLSHDRLGKVCFSTVLQSVKISRKSCFFVFCFHLHQNVSNYMGRCIMYYHGSCSPGSRAANVPLSVLKLSVNLNQDWSISGSQSLKIVQLQ